MSAHPPNPDLGAALRRIGSLCDSEGFTLRVDHVSVSGETAYCWIDDGRIRVFLRVSDHRSRHFRPEITRDTGRVQRLCQVLTHRPGTFDHLAGYLRARARRRPSG